VEPLKGMSMELPLLLSMINEHGAVAHRTTEVVSRDLAGRIHRLTFQQMNRRTKQLANALTRRGFGLGSRIATLAWNTHRHMELFYGFTGIGTAIHTVNPRLTTEHLTYIINDAGGEALFFDADMLPQVEEIAPNLTRIRHFVVLEAPGDMPQSSLPLESYEAWLTAEPDTFDWPTFDERTASTICYTSGTTGRPKGVVYSHRSTFLQTMTLANLGWLPVPRRNPLVLMPLAPMFHSNAWNYPFGAFFMGKKLVLPGRDLTPRGVQELVVQERVTNMALVPSIASNLLEWVEANGLSLEPLETMITSGAGMAPALLRRLRDGYGIEASHTWGMTECMFGSSGAITARDAALPEDDQIPWRCMDGRQTPGMVFEIFDDDGNVLPHDGKARGHLRVKGLWATRSYLNQPEGSAVDERGWMITGDIATLDEDGYLRLVDRDKDLIKSGGEWISSADIEKLACAHPDVVLAAVIGVQHPKWQERPILLVQRREGSSVSTEDILDAVRPHVAKWWVPDAVVFVDRFPLTGTNKIRKPDLRVEYADYLLDRAS